MSYNQNQKGVQRNNNTGPSDYYSSQGNRSMTNYDVFMQKYEAKTFKDVQYNIIEETDRNLFTMGKEYALATCLASDLKMGSGISVTFRQNFKGLDELMAQNPCSGGLVFLHHNNERFIYYLITKEQARMKPTYETLYNALEKLCEHMVAHCVNLLAIPRLGCGLDQLEWDIVKVMIEYIFSGTNVKITCCNFQQVKFYPKPKKSIVKAPKPTKVETKEMFEKKVSKHSGNPRFEEYGGPDSSMTNRLQAEQFKTTKNTVPPKTESPLQNTTLANAEKLHPIVPPTGSYNGWNDDPVFPTTHKLQDQKYKSTKNMVPSKIKESIVTSMVDKLEVNDNFKRKVSNYEVFMQKNEANTFIDMKYVIVEEINGNVFEMRKEYALAICVAADLNMGSGIAVTFRQEFKGFGELMSQNPHTGGLVFLHHNDKRYIYYLITKEESVKKPTYETLYKSLEKLREHMVANEVKLLAIPRLGGGIDRLKWNIVKPMIEYVFTGTDVKITCCNFQQADEQMRKKKIDLQFRKCPTKYINESIKTIKPYAIVLYIGALDGSVDENLATLFNRFPTAQADYRRNNPGQLGVHIVTVVENYKYYVVGCIAKKSIKDLHVDYVQFEKCISDVKMTNEKFRRDAQQYDVIAIQRYDSPQDDIYMEKLVNLLKTYLYCVTICIYNN